MYERGEFDTKKIVAARVLTVQLATILYPAAILRIGVETQKSNLSKLYTPKSCMQKENIIRKKIVPARVLTVQLATISGPAAILKIGIEILKSNLSKLYTRKSGMQEENMIQ